MDQCPKIEISQNRITGIPGIDAQHKELFFVFDSFLKSLQKKDFSEDFVHSNIQTIIVHLLSHFSTEENLMEMISFPKLKEHKDQHRNIINVLKNETKNLANITGSEIRKLVLSFQHKILTHIDVFDREYALFIENLMDARKKFNITTFEAQQIAG